MNSSNLSYDSNGVNTLGLAAVLRLADELDVTSDRFGRNAMVEQLSRTDEEQAFSVDRWEDLRFCSRINIQCDDTFKLNYVCDDTYIKNVA